MSIHYVGSEIMLTWPVSWPVESKRCNVPVSVFDSLLPFFYSYISHKYLYIYIESNQLHTRIFRVQRSGFAGGRKDMPCPRGGTWWRGPQAPFSLGGCPLSPEAGYIVVLQPFAYRHHWRIYHYKLSDSCNFLSGEWVLMLDMSSCV